MDTKEKEIKRFLKRKNGSEIEADEMLKEKYGKVFGNDYLERVEVIDIQTAYNDNKKLYDDLHELAKGWGRKIVCLSSSTDILDFVKMKDVRKACKRKRIAGKHFLLSGSKIGVGFLTLLSIAQIMCSFIFGENYSLPTEIVLPFLCGCLLVVCILAIRLTKINDRKIWEKLDSLDEAGLIDVYSGLEQKKGQMKEEGIFFIENFGRLSKHCRSYVIAYLCHKEYSKQIWCIFDYIFEDSLKIDSVKEAVFYESFKLVPLKFEEKEALYKKHNLQREIDKEYLNCIGVDILWGSKTDIANGDFKFHSLKYIRKRINKIRKKLDANGSLIGFFYCLVYMSAKYKYSFSIDQIISLVRNEEKVNQDLRAVINNAGKKVYKGDIKSKEEISEFIAKIVKLLEGYYFIEYKREGGRKVKKYKFSYDILESLQEKEKVDYPDEEVLKRWVLVKLISNNDMFRMDTYFYDCSNLLVTSDFLEDNEFCILASYLLRIMNANNCWVYNGPILKRMRFIEENIRKQYVQTEVMKRAAGNYLFYVSDNESMQYGIYFLANIEGSNIDLDDFSLNSFEVWMPEMEKYGSILVGYFKLLYKIFGSVIMSHFLIGIRFQDVDIKPIKEQDSLPEIIRKLFICCIFGLNGYPFRQIFGENSEWIAKQLPKIRTCAEANEFASVVEEILSWVRSELEGDKDRAYRNIYTGMLIETSNSNMLYFIYGLLNMALIKDREMLYKNKNILLDFISRSVFYFKVVTQAEGITRYVDELLQSRQPLDLKLNIAINLLIRANPCGEVLRRFIIENLGRAEILMLSCMENQDMKQMEDYIALLLLYNANMDSKEFTEKIFGHISNYISESEYMERDRINKYLQVILEKKCPEEEATDIVDEINQIDSPDFAVWVLYGYCKAKKEMLERIPQINLNVLTKCRSNLSSILMSQYLLEHSYYDCSQEILELYLEAMRNDAFPNENIILGYLSIIDKYAKDNRKIKDNEMGVYNYLLSLYLFYMAVKLTEQKESDTVLLQGTMRFMLYVFRSLLMFGMTFDAENLFGSLVKVNGTLTRNQEADKLVIDKFLYLTPVVSIRGKNYLSRDYYDMLLYMYTFPDVCTPLLKKADKKRMEMINQKHMLYLVNVLLECTQFNTYGFDRENLYRVRDILRERYNIKY